MSDAPPADQLVRDAMVAASIPDVLLAARPEKIIPGHWAEVSRIIDEGRGLYLQGKAGRGKSFIASAILCASITAQLRANIPQEKIAKHLHFVGANELICEIRSSFGSAHHASRDAKTDIDIIDQYSNYDVLVLDDLGVNKPTEFVIQVFDMIVDFRYKSRGRKTIITSNLTLNELAEKYDDRIASRIAGMCEVLEVVGEDRRMAR
jgi:DNA replication protein DnaC